MDSGNEHNAALQPQGGGGVLLARPDNYRSDLRLAARMIGLGVVDVETAKSLLVQSFDLAAAANSSRVYAAAMLVPVAMARLELNVKKHDRVVR